MTNSREDLVEGPKGREFRKTVTIRAVQFTQEMMAAHVLDRAPIPEGVHLGSANFHRDRREVHSAHFIVATLEGNLTVSPGDWIATGVKGEHWAIKPDVFAASYEPVQSLSAPQGESGEWVLVPRDDANRSFSDSLLPREMIEAGEKVLEQAYLDGINYKPGETIDWDYGMEAVAVYRAMLAVSPSPTSSESVSVGGDAPPWSSIAPGLRFGRRLTADAVETLKPGVLLRFHSDDVWFEPPINGPDLGEIVRFTGNVNRDFPRVGDHLEVQALEGTTYPGGGWVYRLFQFVGEQRELGATLPQADPAAPSDPS